MIDRLMVDFAAAVRSLRAAPAIPAAVVVTTSLAVAMNLAMAGLIDRALLSPPAHVVEPERIFTVGFEVRPPGGDTQVVATASYLMFEAVRDRVAGISAAGWQDSNTAVVIDDNRVAVKTTAVTGDYFAMLGAPAQLGRTILFDDDRPPVGAPVAVLSHSFWRSGFASDPQVIGRTLRFGSQTLEVIGVMPAGFSGHTAQRVDLWLPLSTAMQNEPGWHQQRNMAMMAIGVRLAPAQSKAVAETRLGAAAGTRVILAPIIGADVAPDPHRIAMWLTAVSLIVLAAGLANAATLCLARGARRRREISIRAAMGATRGRLFRQLLFEFAIIASAATAVALMLGFWFDELVRRILFPTLVERSGPNTIVLVAALAGGALTFVVGIGAGIVQLPTRVSAEDLNGRRRIWRRSGVQSELLTLQTTLAVILITGAGMFAQSYVTMAAANHDARLDHVLMVSFDDGPGAVRDQDQLLFTAVDRVRKLPGVETATFFRTLPFGRGILGVPITIPGVAEPRLDGRPPFLIESTPELFEILGIDIVRGRGFTSANDRGAPVVIVNETMAQAMWPGGNAIGKCIRIDVDPAAKAPCREVIGVARDSRRPNAERPGSRRIMHYFVPFEQGLRELSLPRAEGIVIRTDPNAGLKADAIRSAVTGGVSDLPFVDVQSYAPFDGQRVNHWLIGTQLLMLFGALALATTALGLYAAFAHAVTERRLEMAIRLAIGASRQHVLRMMLREGIVLTARGAINGFIVATLVGWAARSIIFGLSSPGPLVIAAVTGLVVVVAIGATWFPALAASRAEPNMLLKVE